MATEAMVRGEIRDVQDRPSAIETAIDAVRTITLTDADERTAEVNRLFASHFRATGPGSTFCPHGEAGGVLPADFSAFSDREIEISGVSETGDRVIVSAVFRGTHVGAFQGTEPTGRERRADGLFVLRVVGGLVEEAWSLMRWR